MNRYEIEKLYKSKLKEFSTMINSIIKKANQLYQMQIMID